MRLSDIPLPVLVALFLAIFVLIGIHPAIKRAMAEVRKKLGESDRPGKPFASLLGDAHKEVFAEASTNAVLNDFEIIVLRRIAQADGKALSRKQVNGTLLLGDAVLTRTLKSLNRRRMISVQFSSLLGPRFVLNEAGRRYALEQGYIVLVRESKGLL